MEKTFYALLLLLERTYKLSGTLRDQRWFKLVKITSPPLIRTFCANIFTRTGGKSLSQSADMFWSPFNNLSFFIAHLNFSVSQQHGSLLEIRWSFMASLIWFKNILTHSENTKRVQIDTNLWGIFYGNTHTHTHPYSVSLIWKYLGPLHCYTDKITNLLDKYQTIFWHANGIFHVLVVSNYKVCFST